jgi:hypothetical protein
MIYHTVTSIISFQWNDLGRFKNCSDWWRFIHICSWFLSLSENERYEEDLGWNRDFEIGAFNPCDENEWCVEGMEDRTVTVVPSPSVNTFDVGGWRRRTNGLLIKFVVGEVGN